jgi:hypothetical protein
MFIFTVLSVLSLSATSDDGENERLTRTAVARFSENLNGMKDFAFIYEGTIRFSDPAQADHARPDRLDKDFQGNYAFRVRDAATVMDIYEQRLAGILPLNHETFVLLGSSLQHRHQTPDLDRAISAPVKQAGSPESLNRSASPQFFSTFWLVRNLSRDPKAWDFHCTGWDTIDGRQCVRAQMNELFEGNFPNKPVIRLWIDLERGGMPIKLEHERDKVTIKRVEKVRLGRFSLPGGGFVWFPLGGSSKTFSFKNGENPNSPHFEEVSNVVNGSLRFNQGLTDNDFSFRPGGRILTLSKKLGADRRFELARSKSVKPEQRTDREGVESTLKKRLAEANEQATELQADTGEEAINFQKIQVVLSLLGICVIVGIIVWKRRNR